MIRWIEGFDLNTREDGAGFLARYVDVTLPGELAFVSGRREKLALSASPDPIEFSTPVFTAHDVWVVGMAISGQDPEDGIHLIEFLKGGDSQLFMRASGTTDQDVFLEVVRGTTVLGSYTLPKSSDFSYMELRVAIHETNGSIELRFNEFPVLLVEDVNTAELAESGCDQIAFHFETDSFNDHLYIDDLYIVDGSGDDNTSFLGECVVEEFLANAEGEFQEWDARTEEDTHLDMIDDEDGPDGSDSFVAPSDIDLTETFRFDGPDVIETVLGVQLEAVCGIDDDPQHIKLLTVVEGNEYVSGNKTISTLIPDFKSVHEVWEANPDTDAAWTPADLVAVEFGVRERGMSNFTIAGRTVVAANGNVAPTNQLTGQKILRDNNGRLWAWTYKTGGAYTGKIVVQYSDDNGSTWSAGEVVDTPNQVGREEPGIFMGNDGKLVLSAQDPADLNSQAFWRRTGDDVTPAWTKLSVSVDWGFPSSMEGCYLNYIQSRTTGDWWVFYLKQTDATKLFAKRSTDNLASFGAEMTVGTGAASLYGSHFNSGACWFDAAGALYVGLVSQWASGAGAYNPNIYRWSGLAWTRYDQGTTFVAGGAGFSAAHFLLTVDELYIVLAVGKYGPGENLAIYRTQPANLVAGWTLEANLDTRRGGPRLSQSADGVVHLTASNNGTDANYYRSNNDGGTWTAVEVINTGLGGNHTPFLLDRKSSFLAPATGCAVLVIREGATDETYYLGSDDLTFPVIASGLHVTRLVLRALGTPPVPVVPLDLPDVLPNMLLANWDGAVSIESSFQTDIVASADDIAEERRALADRPTRIMHVRFSGMSRRLNVKLLANLSRLAHSRVPVPLYCDEARTTAASSGKVVWLDPSKRRFFKGGRVVLFNVEDGEPVDVCYRLIDKIAPDRLLLTVDLPMEYDEDTRVYPCLDCEVTLESQANLVTDAAAEAEVTFSEVFGWSALPASVFLNPNEFPLIAERPVLDLAPDWNGRIESAVVRAGQRYQQGRAEIVFTTGARPQFKHTLFFASLGRDDIWSLIRFFDSRRGRARAFWIVSPAVIFVPVAFGADYVDVEGFGNFEDIAEFIVYVAIVTDELTILELTGVAENEDGTFRLSHDGDTTLFTVEDVERMTSAHLVRMAKDTMTENWRSTEIADATFEVVDLLSEEDVEVPGL